MNLYLDTEFNGFEGELISMALVSEDGVLEWYGAKFIGKAYTQWVRDNVIPVLNIEQDYPHVFKHRFHQFICAFDNLMIICDWHTDAQHFCAQLAGNDYGSSLDFACNITILRTPPNLNLNSVTPHNALSDARALMHWHKSIS